MLTFIEPCLKSYWSKYTMLAVSAPQIGKATWLHELVPPVHVRGQTYVGERRFGSTRTPQLQLQHIVLTSYLEDSHSMTLKSLGDLREWTGILRPCSPSNSTRFIPPRLPRKEAWAALRSPAKSPTVCGLNGYYHKTKTPTKQETNTPKSSNAKEPHHWEPPRTFRKLSPPRSDPTSLHGVSALEPGGRL